MKILGIDLETTGLNTKEDLIIEAGAVLWDTDLGTPVKIYSELVYNLKKVISPEITEITGITDDMVFEYGKSAPIVLEELEELAGMADYVVAHNGNDFDKPMLMSNLARFSGIGGQSNFDRIWLDTKWDIVYPKHIKNRSLITLAAEHGFLNPFPHRAVTDVLTTLRIMSCYDIHKIIERSSYPEIDIIADVSYQDRALAKEAKFYWNGEEKLWFTRLKECDVEEKSKEWKFNWYKKSEMKPKGVDNSQIQMQGV